MYFDMVTITKCTMLLDAERLVTELGKQGIAATIKDRAQVLSNLVADVRACYPFIEVQVSAEDVNRAKLLIHQRS